MPSSASASASSSARRPSDIADSSYNDSEVVEMEKLNRHTFSDTAPGVGRLESGHLELSCVRGFLREEIKSLEGNIRDDPMKLLEALDHTDIYPSESLPGSFFVSFEYCFLSDELRVFMDLEPSSYVRSEMVKCLNSVIHETLLDVEFHATTLKNIRVPELLAMMKVSMVPFEETKKKFTAEDLRRTFFELVSNLKFERRYSSPIAQHVSPVISHSLPCETGEKLEFTHFFNTFVADWIPHALKQDPQFVSKPFATSNQIPSVVVKIYRSDSDCDKLIGSSIITVADLLNHQAPFQRFWAVFHAPFQYVLTRTADDPTNYDMNFERVNSSMSSLTTIHGAKKSFNRGEPVLKKEPLEKHVFSALWRLVTFLNLEVGFSSPFKVLFSALSCLRTKGDVQKLSGGWSVRVTYAHKNPFYGELMLQSLFVPFEWNRQTLPVPELRTMEDHIAFEDKVFRNPYDSCGAPIIPAIYDPNLSLAGIKTTEIDTIRRTGLATWEAEDYQDILTREAYAHMLDANSMLKWKYFLKARDESGVPLIPSGYEQWRSLETAYEIYADASRLDGNWEHTVNFQCGPQLPRFLVEVWAEDEFCGELLLPHLADLATAQAPQNLWRLNLQTPDVRYHRQDNRKKASAIKSRGWIWMRAQWRLINPRNGRLEVILREVRDIQVSSKSKHDILPGSPRCMVWQSTQIPGDWKKVLEFSPFGHALYFLRPGQGKKAMIQRWKWDSQEMGGPEPDWVNYFAWDAPGKLKTECREVPVLIEGDYQIQKSLRFHSLQHHMNALDMRMAMWTLTKNGIPMVARPFLWFELSGAAYIKDVVDKWSVDNIPELSHSADSTAYTFLRSSYSRSTSSLLNLISSDVDFMCNVYGVHDFARRDLLSSVLKSLAVFCCPPSHSEFLLEAGDKSPVTLMNISKQGVNIGNPIAYHSGLTRILFFLTLDFGGMRLPEEHLFYLLVALHCASSKSRLDDFSSPFLNYCSLPENNWNDIFNCEIPAAMSDCYLMRIALRDKYPKYFTTLETCGVSLVDSFMPLMMSLYAGILPSMSLYRLWDMLFNVLWATETVVDLPVSFSQIERHLGAIEEESRSSTPLSGMPCFTTAPGLSKPNNKVRKEFSLNDESHYADKTNAHEALFDGSIGRRLLFSFSFSLLIATLRRLPESPSAAEFRKSLFSTAALLRDPAEVVRMIERTDFVLFSSSVYVTNFKELLNLEINERKLQVRPYAEQNEVWSNALLPTSLQLLHQSPTNYILEPDLNPEVSRAYRLSGISGNHPGLHISDMMDIIYPSLKLHGVYAHPDIRSLPRGASGRLVLKWDRIESTLPMTEPFYLVANFAHTWEKSFVACPPNSNIFHPAQDNIFIFNIPEDATPPYSLHIRLKDANKEWIAQSKRPIRISNLKTQGQKYVMLDFHMFEPSNRYRIHLSWFMQGPQYIPEGVEGSTIRPGEGVWGDLGVYPPFHVALDLDGTDRQYCSLQGFHPLPTAGKPVHGLVKAQWNDILYFSYPELLLHFDDIMEKLNPTPTDGIDKYDFERQLKRPLSLRQVVTDLSIGSSGDLLEKALILFDAFGHHEPETFNALLQKGYDKTGFQMNGATFLYYHPTYSLVAPAPTFAMRLSDMYKLDVLARSGDAMLAPEIMNELTDERVIRNSISMAACTAMIAMILARSCYHMNYLEMIQMACNTFDPEQRCPRVLAANLVPSTTHVAIDPLTARHSKRPVCGLTMCSSGDGYRELSASIDVTRRFIEFVARNTSETGWYGLDFFRNNSLESMRIPDPYVTVNKKLVVLLTPTGNLTDVHCVSVDIDGEGFCYAGEGGNYLAVQMNPEKCHTANIGHWASRRADLFPTSGGPQGLLAACYAFDLHSICIDKRQFLVSIMSNTILTDILRRANTFSRDFTVEEGMSIEAALICDFRNGEPLKPQYPLSFENKQPNPKNPKRKSIQSFDSGSDFSSFGRDLSARKKPVVMEFTEVPLAQQNSQSSRVSQSAVMLTETMKGSQTGLQDTGAPTSNRSKMSSKSSSKSSKKPPVEFVNEEIVASEIPDALEKQGSNATSSVTSSKSSSAQQQTKVVATQKAPPKPKSSWIVPDIPVYIRVVRATDLKDTEHFGDADPYVKIQCGKLVIESPTIEDGGTEPIWNYACKFKAIDRIIKFTVMDKNNMSKDDIMGQGELRLGQHDLQGCETLSIPLYTEDMTRQGNLEILFGAGGVNNPAYRTAKPERPLKSLQWASGPPHLRLRIISGRDLKDTEKFGKSDPYVVVTCGSQTHSTPVVEDAGSNPIFSFDISFYPECPILKFAVMDKNSVSSDDVMGTGELNLGTITGRQSEKSVNLQLTTKKGKQEGTLQLYVDLTSGALEAAPGAAPGNVDTSIGRLDSRMSDTAMMGGGSPEAFPATSAGAEIGYRGISNARDFDEDNCVVISVKRLINAGPSAGSLERAERYVVLTSGSEQRKTEAKQASVDGDVMFNDTFGFPYSNCSTIAIHVFEMVPGQPDVLLGTNEVQVENLLNGGKKSHSIILPLGDTLIGNSEIELAISVPDSLVGRQEPLSMESVYLVVRVHSARNLQLPRDTDMKRLLYCALGFGEHGIKTQVSPAHSSGTATWRARFQFPCKDRGGADPTIRFNLYEWKEQAGGDDLPIGVASVHAEDIFKQWINGGRAPMPIILPINGLCRGEFVGILDFLVTPDKYLDLYKYLRFRIVKTRNVPAEFCRVEVRIGDDVMSTQMGQADSSAETYFNRPLDFANKGSQKAVITAIDHLENAVASGSYDLWGPLRQNKKEESGELPLVNYEQRNCGHVSLDVEFFEPVESDVDLLILEFHDCLFYKGVTDHDLPELTFHCAAVGSSLAPPLARSQGKPLVKTLADEGDEELASRLSSLASDVNTDSNNGMSSFHVGVGYPVIYEGQRFAWADISLHDKRVYHANIPLEDIVKSGNEGTIHRSFPIIDFAEGKKAGEISTTIKLLRKPEGITKPKFVKVELRHGTNVGRHDSRPIVKLSLGVGAPVTSAPAKSGVNPRWNQGWIFDYGAHPVLRVQAFDQANREELIGNGQINLWEFFKRGGSKNATCSLKSRNGEPMGSVTVSIDFVLGRPETIVPSKLLVGWRRGTDVGGNIFRAALEDEYDLRLVSGSNKMLAPKSKNKRSPEWGDYTGYLDLQSDSDFLTLELFEKTTSEVVAAASLHLWYIFRDPWKDWAGEVVLQPVDESDGPSAGSVYLALRLDIPRRIRVGFGNADPDKHHSISVLPHDNPGIFKRKFLAACQEIAKKKRESGAQSHLQTFYDLARISDLHRVRLKMSNGQEVILADERRNFYKYPELRDPRKTYRLEIVPPDEDQTSSDDIRVAADVSVEQRGSICTSSSGQRGSVSGQKSPGRTAQEDDFNRALDRQQSGVRSKTQRRDRLRGGSPSNTRSHSSLIAEGDFWVSKLPTGETTMPPPLTAPYSVRLVREAARHVPRSLDVRDHLLALVMMKAFELHPDSFCPMKCLAYVNQPLSELSRLSNQHLALRTIRRSNQWVPAAMTRFGDKGFDSVKVPPIESVAGFNEPTQCVSVHSALYETLPCFADGPLLHSGLLYSGCSPTRSAPFVSTGAAPWIPAQIARTVSWERQERRAAEDLAMANTLQRGSTAAKSSRRSIDNKSPTSKRLSNTTMTSEISSFLNSSHDDSANNKTNDLYKYTLTQGNALRYNETRTYGAGTAPRQNFLYPDKTTTPGSGSRRVSNSQYY